MISIFYPLFCLVNSYKSQKYKNPYSLFLPIYAVIIRLIFANDDKLIIASERSPSPFPGSATPTYNIAN